MHFPAHVFRCIPSTLVCIIETLFAHQENTKRKKRKFLSEIKKKLGRGIAKIVEGMHEKVYWGTSIEHVKLESKLERPI